MPNVLVLCHGNINRSPFCAAVLAAKGVPVRSAGYVNPNRRAAKKTREFAARKGLSLEDHRSRLVTAQDVRWADAVVLMDARNLRMFPFKHKRIICLNVADPGFLPRGEKYNAIMESLEAKSLRLVKEL